MTGVSWSSILIGGSDRPAVEKSQPSSGVDTSKVPTYDEEGRVSGILGMYSNITGRIDSAKLLSQGTEILRAMSYSARAMVEHSD